MSNLRLAIRSMLAQPAWTVIALMCLAIGTAANTAGLSVIEAIFFRPLPFPEPDSIVAVVVQAQLQFDSFEAALAQSRGVAAPLTMLVTPANGLGFGAAASAAALGGSAFVLSLTGLVLAVSVANVAGLLLARAVARRREISLKLALGAAPGLIIRQVLMESTVLGLAGTSLGVLLGAALFRIPGSLVTLPEHLVYAIDFHPDARVFLLGVLTSLGVTVLFGLIPALRAGRTDVMDALRQSAGAGRTPSALRALSILAVGQMAICTVFLVGAGILTRTYWNSENAEPGFETRNTLGVTLDLTQGGYDQAGGRWAFANLLRNADALPGVESVSLTREAPLAPLARTVSIRASEGASTNADSKVISPDHFKTLRIPFLGGRDFAPSDSNVAIVNQKLAEQLWPGTSPLGKTFRLSDPSAPPIEVIGVVRDTHYRSLLEDPHAEFYQPLSQIFAPQMTMLIRSATEPSRLVDAVRQMIRAESPDLAAVDIRTLAAVREASVSSRRITAGLLTSICLAGLLLGAVGLFGVIAFAVRNRTREFGIRIALGARQSDVLRMVLARGLRLASIGFLIGAVLSYGVARLLASLITGVQANDPLTLVAVSCILAATALTASFLPARWATRVDPVVALRND